jgi:type IV pilus assembly protein PilM
MSVLISGVGDPSQVDLARILQTTIDELLREIRRSINFFQSQLEDEVPSPLVEILLTGGGSQIQGLAPYMTARLGTDTRVVDPFDSSYLEMTPEAEEWLRAQGPHLGVALGLAIKEHMSLMGGKA